MNKILSVSVAAYNAEKWLGKCLDSFLVEEILEELEVIVVNDGSKDDTSAVAGKYCEQYPDTFRLVEKENGGHGSTINASIAVATGRYFKVVDADDWVENDGLLDLVHHLRNTDVDFVLSPYYEVYAENGHKILRSCFTEEISLKDMEQKLDIEKYADKIYLTMHGSTYKTQLLKRNPYRIDEHCFYVDVEYNLYYLLSVKTVMFLQKPVYNYLLGTSEQSVNLKNMQKRRMEHLHVFCKVMEFYNNEKKNMSTGISEIVEERLANMVMTEYGILLSLEDTNASCKETREFYEYLEQNCAVISKRAFETGKQLKSKRMLFVQMMGKLRFIGFKALHPLLYRQIVN